MEPTPTDNPLFDLDNVIITPHMAGQSQETALRAAHFAYGNILRVLDGGEAESLGDAGVTHVASPAIPKRSLFIRPWCPGIVAI